MAYDVSKTLGNYRLLQLLGQGGFADVYLGEHIYLKTSAAIKVMRVLLSSDAFPPFLAEARTIASLRHPHIVIVHDFGIEHEVPFLVMGYAPYGSLRRLHPMGSTVPLKTVALYVRQMADALQYAHDKKVIHRDVKPENILLGDRQVLMLSDFGIAVTLNSMPSNPIVREKGTVGTTTYMAPELFTGEAVFASDQYSLGIAVYEWLSGSVPFNGSDMEIALQHVHITMPALRDKVQGLPDAVEHVVRKALAKHPEERFPSIAEFADAFERALNGRQVYVEPEISSVPPTLPPLAATLDRDTDNGPGLQKLDQVTWHAAPQMLRFGKPVWMESQLPSSEVANQSTSQPVAADDRKSAMAQVPVSLKLPAQTQMGSKRFFDYASSPDHASVPDIEGAANTFSPLKPLMKLSQYAPNQVVPHRPQSPAWQKLQALPVVQKLQALPAVSALTQKWSSQVAPTVKHFWQDQAGPKAKHFWQDQAVPTARHFWQDQAVPTARSARSVWLKRTVPSLRRFWTGQAVPAAKKISSIKLLSIDEPRLDPLDLYAARQNLSTSRPMLSSQPARMYPPIQSDQKISRRVLIGGIAAVATASVVGVVATAATQGVFSPKPVVPTPVPTQAPLKAQPTQATKNTVAPVSDPQNLTLQAPTRPSVASSSIGQMDVFIRGSDGGLWQRHYAGQWGAWGMDVGGLTFDPVVTSWGVGRFDAFARGSDNTLQHTWYDGQWHPWESLGGVLTSDPAAVAWGPNRLDIFVRSTDNALWHKAYDGSWHDWESLGGVLLSSPSVSTWGPNRLDVFVRGSDNALWHKAYDGSWHDWESLGGSFDSDPGAVSVAANRLDVFVRGAGNVLQHVSYDGSWHSWESLGGILTSSPCAITWESGRIDVFARTANNILQQTWNEATTWSSWVSLT
jgi:serine/threonine protein kinase